MCKVCKTFLLTIVCVVAFIVTYVALEQKGSRQSEITNMRTIEGQREVVEFSQTEEEEDSEVKTFVLEETAYSSCEQPIITEEMEVKAQEINEKLVNATNLVDQLTSTYSEENLEIEKQVTQELTEIEKMLEGESEYFDEILAQYIKTKESLEAYVQMLKSIEDKIACIEISSSTDMSQTYGFTIEELTYILQNARGKRGNLIIEDAEVAGKVAKTIVETVVESPVNELFAVSVMSFETGYFTSTLCVKYNNVGGMKNSNTGEYFHYDTLEEGVAKDVRCIKSNMRKNNTANDINESYCAPRVKMDEKGEVIVDENGKVVMDPYGWAKDVLRIMKMYAGATSAFQYNKSEA